MKKVLNALFKFFGWVIFFIFTPFYGAITIVLILVATIVFLTAIPVYFSFSKLTGKELIKDIPIIDMD